ncbi:MAG: TlpA disulfide reductase family protein [Ezakiella sp.]|uniref:TlpA family protein disulfide reductase n=1 Tax=Ezakiella sp. TaxID=1935205 RepID=UPI002970241A|nr:TlpA disulfide reductase family protein [Ezakiella sp.]MDD7731412.1 TlpA disulfide reductase family protein [Eubacteriales bacterium]MDY6080442.1 TlpA disulfide reductase family protein [Ezakiella sp.]
MKKRLLLIALIASFMLGCKNDVKKVEDNKNEVATEAESEEFDEHIKMTDAILSEKHEERTFGDELKKGAPAVDIKVVDLNGNEATLNDILSGDELTQIDFFQTTCKFCIQAMPDLVELDKRDDVRVVLVDVGESVETVKEFMKKQEIALPVVVDESGEIAQKYFISGFPTSVFIDKDGILKGGVVGYRAMDDMIEVIEDMNK